MLSRFHLAYPPQTHYIKYDKLSTTKLTNLHNSLFDIGPSSHDAIEDKTGQSKECAIIGRLLYYLTTCSMMLSSINCDIYNANSKKPMIFNFSLHLCNKLKQRTPYRPQEVLDLTTTSGQGRWAPSVKLWKVFDSFTTTALLVAHEIVNGLFATWLTDSTQHLP